MQITKGSMGLRDMEEAWPGKAGVGGSGPKLDVEEQQGFVSDGGVWVLQQRMDVTVRTPHGQGHGERR